MTSVVTPALTFGNFATVMDVRTDFSLKGMNTFGMDVKADALISYSTEDELRDALKTAVRPLLAIGGGCNLLFMDDFHGTILHSNIRSIEVIDETDATLTVRAGSGIVWDEFVEWTVERGLWGAENLSAIPGEVGASAVQNIGAYGAEAAEIISSVRCISVADGSVRILKNAECCYGYRQSIFKNELKGKYIVTFVDYVLQKTYNPKLEYGPLKRFKESPEPVTPAVIRDVVKGVRAEKLPDPSVLGNAGSFFMNPVITSEHFERLLAQWPDIPSYPATDGMVKVPAGWLIEKSGWKGKVLGPAAVHDKQALVLVNRGGATGADVKRLADKIIEDVELMSGIVLHAEVNYI